MHRNVDILKAADELRVEEQLRHTRLQWLGHVDGCLTTAPEATPQVQTTRKEKARWSFTVVD